MSVCQIRLRNMQPFPASYAGNSAGKSLKIMGERFGEYGRSDGSKTRHCNALSAPEGSMDQRINQTGLRCGQQTSLALRRPLPLRTGTAGNPSGHVPPGWDTDSEPSASINAGPRHPDQRRSQEALSPGPRCSSIPEPHSTALWQCRGQQWRRA